MIKKMMLLAVAVAAVAAFAAPAGASAAMFYHNDSKGVMHEIAVGGEHEDLTGTIAFGGPAGGVSCSADPTINFETNGGQVVSLGVTDGTCVGSGAFEGCEVTNAVLTSGGSLTPTATDIDINGVEILNQFANCFTPELTLNFASVTASPDNSNAITTLTLSGSGSATVPGIGTLPAEASGELEVTNPGTFSVT